jgi:hypothetical protein
VIWLGGRKTRETASFLASAASSAGRGKAPSEPGAFLESIAPPTDSRGEPFIGGGRSARRLGPFQPDLAFLSDTC